MEEVALDEEFASLSPLGSLLPGIADKHGADGANASPDQGGDEARRPLRHDADSCRFPSLTPILVCGARGTPRVVLRVRVGSTTLFLELVVALKVPVEPGATWPR